MEYALKKCMLQKAIKNESIEIQISRSLHLKVPFFPMRCVKIRNVRCLEAQKIAITETVKVLLLGYPVDQFYKIVQIVKLFAKLYRLTSFLFQVTKEQTN